MFTHQTRVRLNVFPVLAGAGPGWATFAGSYQSTDAAQRERHLESDRGRSLVNSNVLLGFERD